MEANKHYKEIPLNISNEYISIDTNSVTNFTHGLHKYPGKFIPQIPQWALKKYIKSKNDIVLDPFMGSGTTLVESLIYGVKSYGVDIDPLSCLISKVKTTPLDTSLIEKIYKWIMVQKECVTPYRPQISTLEHWFSQDAILKLGKLRTCIDMICEKFKDVENINDYYDMYIIALSSIIRRVSNADNQSQKTYVSGTKKKIPAETYNLFDKQIKNYIKAFNNLNSVWDHKTHASVVLSEGEANINHLKELPSKVDLVITSPPYIKSIDYVYNQMAELFWIGDLFDMQNQQKQNVKRKKYIGSTLVGKDKYKYFSLKNVQLDSQQLLDYLKLILQDKKNGQKHAYIVNKYFNFMNKHFSSIFSMLSHGGKYVLTIGNSKVSEINIPTSEILKELAVLNGFEISNEWEYKIKNHYMGFNRQNKGGKIKVDHVITLEKK